MKVHTLNECNFKIKIHESFEINFLEASKHGLHVLVTVILIWFVVGFSMIFFGETGMMKKFVRIILP